MASMLTNLKHFRYCFPSIHYICSFHQEALTAYEDFFLPIHVYTKELFEKVTLLKLMSFFFDFVKNLS